MLNAINIAQSGLTAAAQRLEYTAAGIAAAGTAPEPTSEATPSGLPGARVAYLPLPGSASLAEQMTSLVESEMAFKANAAVIKTAAGMIAALYETLD